MQPRSAQSSPNASKAPAHKKPPARRGSPVVVIVLIAVVAVTGTAIVLPGFLLGGKLASKCWTLSGGSWPDSLNTVADSGNAAFVAEAYVAQFSRGFGPTRTMSITTQCGGLFVAINTGTAGSATVLRALRTRAECSTAGPAAADREVEMMRGLLEVQSLSLDGDRLSLNTSSGARFVFTGGPCKQ